MIARKSFLFDGENIWVKKSNADFDVSIGAWDGAEICEIVGLYILHIIVDVEKVFQSHEIGLFRDDGLAATTGNGHQIDKKRKDLIRIFKNEGLNITWEANIKKVCFLDLMFDLETNS